MCNQLFILFLFFVLLVGCKDDYSDDIKSLQIKVNSLEQVYDNINNEINSLRMVLAALNDGDYITDVTELAGGKGYIISFKKHQAIVIKNGVDGSEGVAGGTPVIGVKQDTDGKWYWTQQVGESEEVWILDSENKKVEVAQQPVIGVDDEGYWTLNGERMRNAAGEPILADMGGNIVFSAIEDNEDNVVFVTATTPPRRIVIPKYKEGSMGEDEVVSDVAVLLLTQEDVDKFGSQKITCLTNELHINNFKGEITDLSPLLSLKHVDMLVLENTKWDSIPGLKNIETLNSLQLEKCEIEDFSALNKVRYMNNLSINNCKLESWKGLENLNKVDWLSLDNSSLESMDGLQELMYVGAMRVSGCSVSQLNFPNLIWATSLSLYIGNSWGGRIDNVKMNNLEEVGDHIQIYGDVFFEFNKLERVGREFTISQNNVLKSLELPSLIEAGELSIYCPWLINLEGLKNLQKVGALSINSCSQLISLVGLENLRELGGLSISNCDDLVKVGTLKNLQRIEGTLSFSGCPQLVSLTGLENLKELGGLSISGCDDLVQIGALKNLQRIEGNLSITTSILSDMSGLDNLTYIGGSLSLNCNVESIKWLQNVVIGGGIYLRLDKLKTLEGLEQLTDIKGKLHLDQCERLINTDALVNLKNVEGDLIIERNDDMETLNLSGLEKVEGKLRFYYNDFKTIAEMSNLVYIGGALEVDYCSELVALPRLGTLEISGGVDIKTCKKLENISNFSTLTRVGNMFKFVDTGIADFSVLKSLLTENVEIYCKGNVYNPTKEDILAGNGSKQR